MKKTLYSSAFALTLLLSSCGLIQHTSKGGNDGLQKEATAEAAPAVAEEPVAPNDQLLNVEELVSVFTDAAHMDAAMKKYGYKFIGVATPTTDPGTPSENVFYLATTEGDYTNFPTNESSVEGPIHFHLGADEVAILRYTNPTDDKPIITNWSKVTLNLTKGTAITEIRTTIEEKQDKLVSGTNIKTVNGQSMLGQGDVAITSGGGGGANINVVDKVPDALEPGTIYLIKSED